MNVPKTVVVIPTYWGRSLPQTWRKGDAIYDHATPLNGVETLSRCLESMHLLGDRQFQVIVIGCATASDIEADVELRLRQLLVSSRCPVPIYLFTHRQLRQLQSTVARIGHAELVALLSLRGYSSIRNACLVASQLAGADVAVLIDDDEVFEDPHFMRKVWESVSPRRSGIAGYYLEPTEDGRRVYLRHRAVPFWMRYWNKFHYQNQAFRQIIGQPPRYKATPFAFGGNMVVHRRLFTRVPFDPAVNRGEDMDYVMNAKMFGTDFFLDNQLAITHLPPPRPHPKYQQLGEDMRRFAYQRQKLLCQRPRSGMRTITPADLRPYPGYFLDRGYAMKVALTCSLLAVDYLRHGDLPGVLGAIANLRYIYRPRADAFVRLIQLQRQWEVLMAALGDLDERDRYLSLARRSGAGWSVRQRP